MASKRAAREARKAAERVQFDNCKSAFVDRMTGPRLAGQPPIAELPRVDQQMAQQADEGAGSPKTAPISRFARRVTWCLTSADRDGHWSWSEPREWTQAEWVGVIEPPMLAFGGLTWREVDRLASGTGHKMHHDHELSDLIQEAQDRWRHRGLEQFDLLFRFRLGGTRRVWGYIVQAHFFFVWWDREHSIYPV